MSMSTRDVIAIEAMSVIMKANIINQRTIWNVIRTAFGKQPESKAVCIPPETVANLAYQYADAMIKERQIPASQKYNSPSQK